MYHTFIEWHNRYRCAADELTISFNTHGAIVVTFVVCLTLTGK